MSRRLLLAIVLLGAAPALLADGAGGGAGGGQGRQRAGDDNAKCGGDLVVVRTDGSREQYASIEKFLAAFPAVEIDQGEKKRSGVALDAVLKAYGADWVEALDCGNHSAHLPVGMPVVLPEFLVMTGRGTLKGVREVRAGAYANTVQQVRKLTFHGAGKKPRR